MKRTMTTVTLALALAGALALSGCSQDDTATFDDPSVQDVSPEGADEEAATDSADSTNGDSSEQNDVTQESATAAGVEPSSLGDPVASATIPAVVVSDPEATMEVSLYSLTRDGESLIGLFSFRVDSADGADEPEWLYTYFGGQVWRPHLINTTDLARHDVLSEGSTSASTESQGVQFQPGQTFYAYAAFAAPSADITTMTVSLADGAPAITGVPIQ